MRGNRSVYRACELNSGTHGNSGCLRQEGYSKCKDSRGLHSEFQVNLGSGQDLVSKNLPL